MTFKNFLAALVLGAAASGAGATVLSFDTLTDFVYGDGNALAAGMRYDGLNLTYTEGGFMLTLHAPNANPGEAHISDGTYSAQTFNWHDGMENGAGTYVTLSRVGGGSFNLASFDYYTDLATLSADGQAVGTLEDMGGWTTALNGITELRLDSGAFNQLDNIDVSAAGAVPLPGTLALLLGGAAAGGLARRRRR